MRNKKISMFITIILIVAIAILLINIIKQKNKESINESTEDIAQTNGENVIITKIVEKPKYYVNILPDGTRKNNSNKITTAKTVGNLTISNIALTSDGNDTFFKADVKSTSKLSGETKLSISLLKEDGSTWIKFEGIVSKTEEENVGKISTTIADYDFTNAYDLKITIK